MLLRASRACVAGTSVTVWICVLGAGGRAAREGHGIIVRGDLASVIYTVAKETNKPLGVFSDNNDVALCPVEPTTLDRRNLPASLDALLRRCPGFEWRREGSSVFLCPRRTVRSPLALDISSYNVTNADQLAMIEAVWSLPEVRRWTSSNIIKRPEFSLGAGHLSRGEDPQRRRVSLRLRNVKLAGLLDAIVRSRGASMWEVALDSDTYMTIFIQ